MLRRSEKIAHASFTSHVFLLDTPATQATPWVIGIFSPGSILSPGETLKAWALTCFEIFFNIPGGKKYRALLGQAFIEKIGRHGHGKGSSASESDYSGDGGSFLFLGNYC